MEKTEAASKGLRQACRLSRSTWEVGMTHHGRETGSGDKEVRRKGAGGVHSGSRQTVQGMAAKESSESHWLLTTR